MNTENSIQSQGASAEPSLASDFFGFLRRTLVWWLLPIVLLAVALGLLVFLGDGGDSPFAYSIF